MLRWKLILFALLFLAVATSLRAQGGPPFLTDDPETPGNHQWEINVGFLGVHHSGDADYDLPNFDINYGWGDRIQLKYEVPITLAKDGSDTEVALGNSLMGVKWRFYQRMREGDEEPQFSFSTYPQLALENPTRAAQRGAVSRGPQFLLPFEFNGHIGWFKYDGEVGHWFNAYDPDQWIGGFLVGREFGKRSEAYTEIYTIQDSTAESGAVRQRQSTLGLGGRYKLTEHIGLLGMWGRSFHSARAGNGEANYVAYLGVQFLLGPKTKQAQPSTSHPLLSHP